MVSENIMETSAALKQALDLENWCVQNSSITISGACLLALSNFEQKDDDGNIINLKTRKAMILKISQEGDLLDKEELSPITND